MSSPSNVCSATAHLTVLSIVYTVILPFYCILLAFLFPFSLCFTGIAENIERILDGWDYYMSKDGETEKEDIPFHKLWWFTLKECGEKYAQLFCLPCDTVHSCIQRQNCCKKV